MDLKRDLGVALVAVAFLAFAINYVLRQGSHMPSELSESSHALVLESCETVCVIMTYFC